MHPVAAYPRTQMVLGIMPKSSEIHPLAALKTREGHCAEIYQDRHWIYKAKVLFATGEVHILDVVADGMRKIWQKLQEPGCCAYVMPTTEGKRALYVGNYGLLGGLPPKAVASLSQEMLNGELVIQDWHVRAICQNEVQGSFYSHRGGAREKTGQTFAGFDEKEAWHVGNKNKHNSILRKYIQFPKKFTLELKADGKPDRSISLSWPGPSGHSLSYDPVSVDIRDDKLVLCLRSLPTEFTIEDMRGQKQKHGKRYNRGIFRSQDRARIEVINLLTGAPIRFFEFTSDFPRQVKFVNENEISVEYDSGKQDILELSSSRIVFFLCLSAKQQESLQKLEALAKDGQWQHLQMQTDNPDSAFDYWMFPIDQPSNKYGDLYKVSHADIAILKKNPLWMKTYRNGVILVAKSWGWDLENQQDLTNSVQRWMGYRVRLEKMHRSLFLFGQDDLLQALDHFATPIFSSAVPSPVASSSAPISASSQIASSSSKAAQKEPEEHEIADEYLVQDDGESESTGVSTNPASKRRKIG